MRRAPTLQQLLLANGYTIGEGGRGDFAWSPARPSPMPERRFGMPSRRAAPARRSTAHSAAGKVPGKAQRPFNASLIQPGSREALYKHWGGHFLFAILKLISHQAAGARSVGSPGLTPRRSAIRRASIGRRFTSGIVETRYSAAADLGVGWACRSAGRLRALHPRARPRSALPKPRSPRCITANIPDGVKRGSRTYTKSAVTSCARLGKRPATSATTS